MAKRSFWQNQCVIITGASSGIGWALAEHLAERGARVGLIARRREKLAQLAVRIEAKGGRAASAVADVTNAPQTERAVRTLERALGPCDVLIASAGIHTQTTGDVFSSEDANAVIATNVGGVINSIGAVLDGMRGRGSGHVVAIASIAAMLGLPRAGAYSASKAALVTLMESLRVDLHPPGVKVTTICPGFVETPMIANHPRSVLRFVLQPPEAARRIAWAIERGKAEYWFPWQTWLAARFARALPFALYARVCERLRKRGSGDSGRR